MKARHTLAVVILALAFASARPGHAGDLEPVVEDLFKWGEYDSLIRFLEPWLAARSAGADARADSVELAQANLFLGVAYWVVEKRPLGEQAFVRACRLDPGLQMDRLYATPEIMARFDAIAAEERRLRENQLDAARAEAERRKQALRGALLWKRWTVGALAAAGLAAGGGYAFYALRDKKTNIIEIPIPVAPSE